ncbi:MAG: peptide deformylase [Gammaproteobacteria bacterium]|jgi:peptide deformylase|nr:peptide deformylase [Gammaproteobacteria bacterium]MBT5202808.1 peptide deformylase [Gammaproteobacteria bacterium]MBT5602305.1 peptide deformylase [Gammaproteobacteria bacterium]MBT6246276.1 peptide deformylase [Gammaproteobacteria bacterium]
MSILEILEFPDSRLRKKALPVTNVTEKEYDLAKQMLSSMYQAPGIGLAATQVNVHQRLIVCDVSEHQDSPLILINPVLKESFGSAESQEGCLSVPGFHETVTRASEILVAAIDEHGNPISKEADGLLAICIQHEMDHLDGKLFVDYLSSTKRQLIRKKLLKIQKLKD